MQQKYWMGGIFMIVTVQDVLAEMRRIAPPELAQSWDNVGLLVDAGRPVSGILTALDITPAVVSEADVLGCELIVSHHPVIFQPLKSLSVKDVPGMLMHKGISAICMHTNLDVAPGGVNDALAAALGLEDPGPLGDPEGLCRMGTLAKEMPLHQFAQHVCRCLGANGVRYADAGRPVRRVAVGGGACGDYESYAIAAGCDTFVTSDLTYHTFLDAPGKGINLIDAGHFPTEDPVCARLLAYLTERFPGLQVTKSASHREVIQYYVEGE